MMGRLSVGRWGIRLIIMRDTRRGRYCSGVEEALCTSVLPECLRNQVFFRTIAVRVAGAEIGRLLPRLASEGSLHRQGGEEVGLCKRLVNVARPCWFECSMVYDNQHCDDRRLFSPLVRKLDETSARSDSCNHRSHIVRAPP